jgi:hypothetical protein
VVGLLGGLFRTKPVLRAEGIGSRLLHLVSLALGIALLMFRRAGGPWLAMRLYRQTVWSIWIGTALIVLGMGFARVHLPVTGAAR